MSTTTTTSPRGRGGSPLSERCTMEKKGGGGHNENYGESDRFLFEFMSIWSD